MQPRHPCAWPAKPRCGHRLCPMLSPQCTGPRAAADRMAMKPHTLVNTTTELAATQEPRTSSPWHWHTTHTQRAALPLPAWHVAPPQPPRPVRQCQQAPTLPLPWELVQALPFPARTPEMWPPRDRTELGSGGGRASPWGGLSTLPAEALAQSPAPGSKDGYRPSQGTMRPIGSLWGQGWGQADAGEQGPIPEMAPGQGEGPCGAVLGPCHQCPALCQAAAVIPVPVPSLHHQPPKTAVTPPALPMH